MGDSYHTDHVHGFTNNSEYECYDRDVTDHVGKCSDGADTPAGTDCAAKFIAADSFEADGCPTAAPDNCTWTKAPVAPNPKPPHPAAASFDGYSHLSGACRSIRRPTGCSTTRPRDVGPACVHLPKAQPL